MQPVPRREVLNAYWHLAAERQEIYFKRLVGAPAPWTDDPILRSYKFCNAYRASDRVSQYLIREVIYADGEYSAEDLLLRIVLFRLFSKPATWELLLSRLGDVRAGSFSRERYGEVLDVAYASGAKLYTGAFILCATRAFGHERKHRNHLALLELMLRPTGLPRQLARSRTLRDLYEALAQYPLIGPFMAYQLAIDINYSELCDFSEDEYTVPGPGAVRGIRKCFVDTAGWDADQLIRWMAERQGEEFERLSLPFKPLFGRALHAIDTQNLFCEVDKYSRVAFPELTSNRSRIKTRFSPGGELPAPFFPPKWGLAADFAQRSEPARERQLSML